jgi:S-formylglutathione hydrolase FrmB
MPNAGGPDIHHTWNGYFNMPGWKYEDFFFQELIPSAEKKYSCGGSKGKRAVMGLSMGGGGSVVYAQKHPDMFSSCYAMSAWLDNKDNKVGRAHKSGDKLEIVCQSVCDHSALDFLDNASEATLNELRNVKWFIDCGDDDFLLELNEDFHRKMKAKRIKSEFRVRDGGHTQEYWHQALRLALPFASRSFDR